MKEKNSKKILKHIVSLSLICLLSILATFNISNASNHIEEEFKSVISQYNSKDIVIEDGISLKMGETLDLSEFPNWKLSNLNTVKINEDGLLETVGKGTVFLSQEIKGKVYIIEVYVSLPKSTYRAVSNDLSRKRDYYKVFIDPGHGGSDSGAVAFGRLEKDLNLQVSKLVENKLTSKGIEVKMSRNTDIYYSLSQRAQMANEYGADVFVSIHQNSFTQEQANGIETLYQEEKVSYKPLSDDIQMNLIKQTSATDRKVKPRNLGVLRESYMPSALVECGFITNEKESEKLADVTYQNKLATAIADGIEIYLKNNIIIGEEVTAQTIGEVSGTSTLNVRSGPSTSYNIIGTLSQGDKVEIIESVNGWYKIKYKNIYGYVSSQFISKIPVDNKPVVEFIDINNHWAKENIENFAYKGFIGGYEDKTFKPDNNITRAEFVRVVNNVFGLTEVGIPVFKDVDKSQWYYNDISIAVKAGYINGYEDKTFKPNNSITREEAASIVTTITNLVGDGKLGYKDSSNIAPWANSSVDALSDNNIMGGYEDNTFRPKNKITRAEAVATLSRVVK